MKMLNNAVDQYDSLVIGNDAEVVETAIQMRRFTEWVTMLTNSGALGLQPDAVRELDERGIPLVVGRVAGARAKQPGVFEAILLEGGGEIELDHLFSIQGAEPNVALARSLGVSLNHHGYVTVDTEAHTNVPGVFAAGDVTRLFSDQVTAAAAEGSAAAEALTYWLFQ